MATTKGQIRKTATSLFLKYGLRSVSIDDICNELHISKKTFYTCYAQKENLIEDIVARQDELASKQFKKFIFIPSQNKNAIDCLMDHVICFEKAQQEKTKQSDRLFFDLHKYYFEIDRMHIKRLHMMMRKNLAILIENGIEEGVFREDINVPISADIITHQCITIMGYVSEHYNKTSREVAKITFLDGLVHTLCNTNGMEYYHRKIEKNDVQISRKSSLTHNEKTAENQEHNHNYHFTSI